MSGQFVIPGTNESIMLKHLREKYGQEFVATGMTGSSNFGGDPVLFCYPKGGDPETDKVRATMSKLKNGERSFEDTYFGIIIREDLESEVLAALPDLQLPMKAYFNCTSFYYDESFDSTKTYVDFKQWEIDSGKSKLLDITIAIPMDGTDKSKKEEYANRIFDILEQYGFRIYITVRFYPSEVFEIITRKNVFDLYKIYDEYALFSKIID